MRKGRIALAIACVALLGVGGCVWTPDIPRAELQKTYLEAAADLRQVDGTLLHVRDTGPREGRPVILIHGTASHLQTWDGWAEGLNDAYRVVRFDLPGSGLSPADPSGDYTDTRTIALLIALMDDLGITKAALVGNSLGGRIAWRAAAAHPERVTKLVLVSPDGFASPPFEYDKAPSVPGYLNVIEYVLPKGMLRSNLEVAYADPERLSDARTDRYHDLLRAPGNRAALLDRLRQTVLVDPVPVLAELTVPTLLIWGEEDGLIPIANAQDYLDALPDGRLVRLPGLGHVPQEEAPAVSLIPLRAFLDGED